MSGPGALLERRGAGAQAQGARVGRGGGFAKGGHVRRNPDEIPSLSRAVRSGADAAQKGNSFFTEAGDSVITAAQRKRVDKNKRFCERGRRKIIQRNGVARVGLGKIIVGIRPLRDCYMSVGR